MLDSILEAVCGEYEQSPEGRKEKTYGGRAFSFHIFICPSSSLVPSIPPTYPLPQVLTWKNNILRRRNFRSWLIELIVPILVTVGLLGMYKTIKPTVTDSNIPGYTDKYTSFDAFLATDGTPQCVNAYGQPTYHDTNVFWRCDANKCDPNTCQKLHFAFAPASASNPTASAAAQDLYEQFNTTYGRNVSTMFFASEAALDDYIQQPGYALDSSINNIGVAIVFDSADPEWKYHIRMNRTAKAGYNYLLPPTTLVTDSLLKGNYDWPKACDRCWGPYVTMYHQSGFLAVQNLVDEFIVSTVAQTPVKLTSAVYDFPSPKYETAGFWATVSQFYGIWMVSK